MGRTVRLLCGCCTLFLLVQWLLSRHFGSDSESKANVADFTSTCHKHGVPILFIDPNILATITYGNNGTAKRNPKCKFLCDTHPITSFGVESSLLRDKDVLLADLAQQGFSGWLYKQPLPHGLVPKGASNPTPSKIQTHLVLERNGHYLLLVVLYERGLRNTEGDGEGEAYLWQGKVQGPAETIWKHKNNARPFNMRKIPFGGHEAAWKRFDISKVTIDGVHLRAPTYPAAFLAMISQSEFIECNHSRAAEFHAKYPQDLSSDASAFRKNARVLLSKAKETLDQLGIRFWLSSGTCLGWYRQCDLIPYSMDVDIGIWIKDYKKTLISAIQMNGLALKHSFGRESDSYELSFQGGDIKLDIFFFYEETDHMWNGGTQARTGNKYKYIFPKFTLCWTEFLGLLFRVPCDTESYVRANYGPDWLIPVTKWDWKRSPPNVHENGRWPKEEWSEVLVTYLVKDKA